MMRFLLKLMAVVLLSVSAIGQTTVNETVTFADFTTQPMANRQITLTPLQPFADYTNTILSAQPRRLVSDTNGSVVFSNVVSGYTYRLELAGPVTTTTRTNGIPIGTTGNINARDYLGVFAGQWFAYIYLTNHISSRIIAGTNIVITTNSAGLPAETITINATSGTFDGTAITNLISTNGINGTNFANLKQGTNANLTAWQGHQTNDYTSTNVWTSTNTVLQAQLNALADAGFSLTNFDATQFTTNAGVQIKSGVGLTNVVSTNSTFNGNVTVTNGYLTIKTNSGLGLRPTINFPYSDDSNTNYITWDIVNGWLFGTTSTGDATALGIASGNIRSTNGQATFKKITLGIGSTLTTDNSGNLSGPTITATVSNLTVNGHIVSDGGTITTDGNGTINAGAFVGDGSGLTGLGTNTSTAFTDLIHAATNNLNATRLTSGTVPLAALGNAQGTNATLTQWQSIATNAISPSQITSNGTYIPSGTLATNSGAANSGFLQETGTSRRYTTDGSNLTNLNGSSIASGTVAGARIDATLGLTNGANLINVPTNAVTSTINLLAAYAPLNAPVFTGTPSTAAGSTTAVSFAIGGSLSNGFAALTTSNITAVIQQTNVMSLNATGHVFTTKGGNNAIWFSTGGLTLSNSAANNTALTFYDGTARNAQLILQADGAQGGQAALEYYDVVNNKTPFLFTAGGTGPGLRMTANALMGFCSDTSFANNQLIDAGLDRSTTGVVEVNNGTKGTLGTLNVKAISAPTNTASVNTASLTFALGSKTTNTTGARLLCHAIIAFQDGVSGTCGATFTNFTQAHGYTVGNTFSLSGITTNEYTMPIMSPNDVVQWTDVSSGGTPTAAATLIQVIQTKF